ncbi:uncharacterized protein [Dermacentor albipictus]|uniref:uncharacterized protein n=1 Tax=Dermacentor albipictus TaxID=60249 RepID=UPI0038FBED7B
MATSAAATKTATNSDPLSSDDLDSPPDTRAQQRHAVGTTVESASTKREFMRTLDKESARSRAGCLIVGFVLFGALTLALVVGTVVMFQSEFSARPPPTTADLSNVTQGDNDTFSSTETKDVDTRLYAPDVQNPMYDYTLQELESAAANGEHSSGLFCGTQPCLNLASFLERRLDDSKDPCQNLYDHVCSSWQAEHVGKAAARGGAYSVDDALLEEYEERIGRALLGDANPPQRSQARFLHGCVAGNLTSSDGLVRDVLSKLAAVRDADSVEPLAEAFFQMARIGVSPLFDLSINVDNDTANVKLLPLVPRNAGASTQANGDDGRGTETAAHRNENSEFLKSLLRHVCREAEKTLKRACLWALASNVSTPWTYKWLKSNGSVLLTAAAASTLKPFWIPTNQKDSKNGSETPVFSNFSALSKSERLRECLNFMNRYEVDTQAISGMHIVPASFKDEALELLHSLKTSLDAATAHGFNVSVALGPLRGFERSSNAHNYALSSVVEDSFFNASRLEGFMRDSTWKQWLGHFDSNAPMLGSTLTLSIGSYVVVVPLPVFDLFAPQDQSLHVLRLARVGPRVLRGVLRQELAKHLRTSRMQQCVSKLSDSKVVADRDVPDIEEIAAFYVSFQAYRRQVGDGMAIPGSSLDSDALFLYHYVFNECEAVSNSTQIGKQLTNSARRRHVASVAKAFGSFASGKCQPMPKSGGCDMDNERLLYGNDTEDS